MQGYCNSRIIIKWVFAPVKFHIVSNDSIQLFFSLLSLFDILVIKVTHSLAREAIKQIFGYKNNNYNDLVSHLQSIRA